MQDPHSSLVSRHMKAHARKAGMLRIQKALAERDAKAIMQDRAGTASSACA